MIGNAFFTADPPYTYLAKGFGFKNARIIYLESVDLGGGRGGLQLARIALAVMTAAYHGKPLLFVYSEPTSLLHTGACMSNCFLHTGSFRSRRPYLARSTVRIVTRYARQRHIFKFRFIELLQATL
jgi:hypothetical protein